LKLTGQIETLWNKGKYWLLIAVVILLALYPLSFLMHIPKWDSVRGYLPYRFFVSDYIQDGHLPLWNPFQRLGYPGYSDLQSACWYPVMWLLMLFGQYDITSLIAEVVITFIIAGWGMFQLSSWMHQCNRTAFLMAISYALSGCMIGSAQLLVFLIGMAWLPWILWAFLQMLRGGGARYSALFAFFLMCNITGASPAFTIVLLYALPSIFIYHLFKSKERIAFAKHFFFQAMVAGTILIMLLAPFIVSFVDFMPYFNRNGKLPYEAITLNPFVWSDYISFLFPYSVISTHEMFQITDLSLRNAYVGIAGLVFFLLTLAFVRRSKWFWGLIAVVIVSMILALGDYSGLYRAIYHLPGFGLFRHPAFFRGYAMLGILLLAGFSMSQWLEGKLSVSRSFLVVSFSLLLAFAGIAWALTEPQLIQKTLNEILDAGEFPAHGFGSQLFVNACIVAVLILLTLIVSKVFSMSRFATLILFVTSDLLIQTRLSAPTTLYHSVDYALTKSYFDELEGLPSHDQSCNSLSLKMLDESTGLLKTEALVSNISTFNRRISSVGENPLRFRSFDQAKDSGLLSWVLENKLVYFPERICMDGDSVGPGCIFDAPVHLDNIGDECLLDSVRVGHNQYESFVENPTEDSRWLILNANYHHLWTARLNELNLPITRVNHLAMGVLIPAETSGTIQFTFTSAALPWSIGLALLGIIVLMVILWRTRNWKAVN
jgi:hypothetical protein